MSDVVILAAVRTPIGKFGGTLKGMTAADLGVAAVRGALEAAGVPPGRVQDVVFGNGRQAGGGPNVARQISVRAGIPHAVPALTVNRACGSGLQAIVDIARQIRGGEIEIGVAGGTESMSRLPFFLDRFRDGYRLGHGEVVDGMYRDGFHCPLANMLMGETAEVLADRYAISRQEQDEYAVETQRRCEAARKAGRFDAERIALDVPDGRGGSVRFQTDEHVRDGATLEGMAKLPPVFRKAGTVHAGNSSGITDGAAAVVLASAAAAAALGAVPLARLEGWDIAGVAPDVMGIGPVPAIRSLEKKTGHPLDTYDVIELNEAFAAQVIACDRELKLPRERLNPNGGSIALGHPIGCTGARIVATLLHEMKRRQAKRGLATLCISGGQGMAVSFTSP
ncbi:MAG: thiolase family protein [Candidatus Brocadiae bacterium]|nr:thiolase family protein [Candidatus Brocadiia bacterium]